MAGLMTQGKIPFRVGLQNNSERKKTEEMDRTRTAIRKKLMIKDEGGYTVFARLNLKLKFFRYTG